MELYAEQIVDLYKHPLNKRVMPNADITHSGANVTCGDYVRVYLKLDGEKIADASFEGNGCAISIAAASLLTDALKGKTIVEISIMKIDDMLELLGTTLGPARVKCGILCLETAQEGIKISQNQQSSGSIRDAV